MISNDLFRVAVVEDKGHVILATVDMLPGKVFLTESPALVIPDKEVQKYFDAEKEMSLLLAGFDAFKELPTLEEIDAILSLFGPTTGDKADMLRNFAKSCPFSDDVTEVELFVKVTNIVRLNAFHAVDYYGIFSTLTRMSHSCTPNAIVEFKNTMCTCRVLRTVRAGEELTLEYSPGHRWKPTPMRREAYAERKDFFCMCARCSAPGDDTRQFDCSDHTCTGLHFAHEHNPEIVRAEDHNAIDVALAQSQMLPCDKCGRVAPDEYQQFMFEMEEKMPAVTAYFRQKADQIDFHYNKSEAIALMERIECIPFPKRHTASAALLYILLDLKCHVATDSNTYDLLQTAHEYRELHEHIFSFPNDTFTVEMYRLSCHLSQVPLLVRAQHMPFHLFLVSCCRALLRVNMIMFGREARIPRIDDILCDRLLKIVRSGHRLEEDPSVCGFCWESPAHADFKLSRCGKCLRVTYCSVDCQKAHWKVHKMTCTPRNNT